jgi:hypothetical protein
LISISERLALGPQNTKKIKNILCDKVLSYKHIVSKSSSTSRVPSSAGSGSSSSQKGKGKSDSWKAPPTSPYSDKVAWAEVLAQSGWDTLDSDGKYHLLFDQITSAPHFWNSWNDTQQMFFGKLQLLISIYNLIVSAMHINTALIASAMHINTIVFYYDFRKCNQVAYSD